MELDDLKQAMDRLDERLESQAALGALNFRREARDRLRESLAPLARAQNWLIATGLASIFIGVAVWQGASNHPGGLFACGVILHIYGVATVLFGAIMKALIGGIDAGGPVIAIQLRLARLRKVHVLAGIVVGLSWCLLWVPAMIATFYLLFGVDLFAPAPALWLWQAAGGGAVMLAILLLHRWARARGWTAIVRAFDHVFTDARLRRAQAELDELARFERG